VRSVKRTTIPVAGREGLAELYRYRQGGHDRTAVRLYFLRDVAEQKLHLCYMLTVVASPAQEKRMLDVFGRLIRSVKLGEVAHPSVEVEAFGPPLRDTRYGYALAPPKEWYAYRHRSVLRMGLMDHLQRAALPQALVAVREVPADEDAGACGRRRLEQLRALNEQAGVTVALHTQGPAKLAGRDAWQYVAVKASATGDEAKPHEKVVIAGREMCARVAPDGPVRNYSLVLYVRGDDVKKAQTLLEKLAGHFELIAPAKDAEAAGQADGAGEDGEGAGASIPTSVPVEGG